MVNLAALKLNRSTVKKLAIVVVVATILIGGIVFLLDWLSYRNVTFNLSSDTKSIAVYGAGYYETYTEEGALDGQDSLGVLQSSGTLRLKIGEYYVVPAGDNLSADPIKVQIKDDTETIDVKPYYSEEYLASTFSDQIPEITTIISDTYSKIIENYTIDEGTFYRYGDWYGTTLYSEVTREGGSDTYGIILHRVDGTWRIAAAPELVFAYSDHKTIPTDIIEAVNRSAND